MKPGDQRTFKKGKGNTVVLAVGLWTEHSRSGKQLHIHMTGTKNFTLQLRMIRTQNGITRILVSNQCWLFGDDGAETEQPDE